MEVIPQFVLDLAQQGVITLPLAILDPVELLSPRAPGIPAVPALRGEGVLREDGHFLLLLLDGPVQGEVNISQLPLPPWRVPHLPSSFFTFLSPFPFLPAEATNVKEYSDEGEYEADDDESLQNEKDKSLDIRVYPEKCWAGEGHRQKGEALVWRVMG